MPQANLLENRQPSKSIRKHLQEIYPLRKQEVEKVWELANEMRRQEAYETKFLPFLKIFWAEHKRLPGVREVKDKIGGEGRAIKRRLLDLKTQALVAKWEREERTKEISKMARKDIEVLKRTGRSKASKEKEDLFLCTSTKENALYSNQEPYRAVENLEPKEDAQAYIQSASSVIAADFGLPFDKRKGSYYHDKAAEDAKRTKSRLELISSKPADEDLFKRGEFGIRD